MLVVCTCAYMRRVPRLKQWFLSEKKGFLGVFYKGTISPDEQNFVCKIVNIFSSFCLYSKSCLKGPLKKKTKIGIQDQLSLNAGQKYCRIIQAEHYAILLTFIKLPIVIEIFVLSIFELPFFDF